MVGSVRITIEPFAEILIIYIAFKIFFIYRSSRILHKPDIFFATLVSYFRKHQKSQGVVSKISTLSPVYENVLVWYVELKKDD